MGLRERVYSVLVVSAGEKLNAALAALLPESTYEPVTYVTSVAAAERAISERAYDLILVNSPLPDATGVHFAIDGSRNRGAVVLLLVRSEVHDEVYDRVMADGVFTLPRPVPRTTMIQALQWMISARERLRRFEKKIQPIEEKMEEIRLVNRAKWLLISELKMSEPDAHHYIEHQAMDRCITKKSLAEDIIKLYS